MPVHARDVAAITLTSVLMASEVCYAALTCEQLFAVTQTAVQYRDQGYSLTQVLAALQSVDAEGKLAPSELEIVRRSVTAAYLGHASPKEIAYECVQARGGK